MKQYRGSRRKFAQGLVARIGDSMSRLRTFIANCIRTVNRVLRSIPDEEVLRDRIEKIRRCRRWSPLKNIQPQFA